jgi:hypothetical protein
MGSGRERGCADAMAAATGAGWGSMTTSNHTPAHYRIRIHGHLDPTWSTWFDGLTITQEQDGTTTLAGSLVDQAALYGLLGRLRDVGAILLIVERLAADRL